MTREDFQMDVNSWYDLRAFCNEYGCSVCEDVYSQEEMDEEIDSNLVQMARDASDWQELYSKLEDIPDGYDYYIKNEDGEFSGADDYDFDDYKANAFDWGEDEGIFEDEEEEDDDYEEELEEIKEHCDPDDEYEVGNEDIPIADLFVVPKNGDRGIYNV